MNSSLENELRNVLTRMEPPEGFVNRVVAKLPGRRRRTPFYMVGAAAAVVVLVLFTRFGQQRLETQRQAPDAQRQIVFAFQLAAEKLAVIDERLKKSAPELQIENEKGKL